MNINSRSLKFKGQMEVSESPDPNKYIQVLGEFEIVETSYKPTHDGTHDEITTIAPIRLVELKEGKSVALRVKGSMATKLRTALWKKYEGEHFDTYYEETMYKLIAHLPEVLELIGK